MALPATKVVQDAVTTEVEEKGKEKSRVAANGFTIKGYFTLPADEKDDPAWMKKYSKFSIRRKIGTTSPDGPKGSQSPSTRKDRT